MLQGPTPAAVNEQYTALIGRPILPAYWTLGFHQCRYGYRNLDEVKEVVARYRDADIPLETMWIDIEYGAATGRCRVPVEARVAALRHASALIAGCGRSCRMPRAICAAT